MPSPSEFAGSSGSSSRGSSSDSEGTLEEDAVRSATEAANTEVPTEIEAADTEAERTEVPTEALKARSPIQTSDQIQSSAFKLQWL